MGASIVPDFDAVDFYTDTSLIDDPRPFYRHLAGKGPVVFLRDRAVAAVTGYEEALQVYANPADFSSVNAVTGPIPGLPFEPEGDDISDALTRRRGEIPFSQEIAALDAPDHARMRSLLMPLFTPSKLKAKADGFRAVADMLIGEFADAGAVEFVRGYANPLATLIITELLGVPKADWPRFRGFFDGTAAKIGASVEDISNNPLVEMGYMIAGYIAERRAAPCDDLLNELARATFPDGTTPTLEEAARAASFLFGAGQDTTQKLLSTSIRVLGERQDLQKLLRDKPERIPDFIEEALRYEGSIKSSHRMCRRSTTLGGVAIPAGTTIMIANLAVNRDARRFAQPDAFDIDRPKIKEHLAFGRGAHTCAGAPLARAEAKLSIERLLARLEDIRIDDDMHGPSDARVYHYEPSYVLRGLEALHIRFRGK